jgi:hypothetical protein
METTEKVRLIGRAQGPVRSYDLRGVYMKKVIRTVIIIICSITGSAMCDKQQDLLHDFSRA